ncbi:S-layer protein [Dehalobacter sp. DCM]|uniref:S-layer protein n=1 Tax=Dehalobacter sp. DCM TaxID=2907827 RepID=UPI0030820D06|nr:S-layer protein [Dehalobacter sp. DCM]
MKPRISRNIAIAICAIIFCLGIVTYSYAQNSTWEGFKIGKQEAYLSASVSGEVSNGAVVLTWDPINHSKFLGYKVVVSKESPNPKYPDNGYLYYITDANMTHAVVDNQENYKNGDFGDKLVPGEKYYFSITTLYSDKTVAGDSLQMTYPLSAVTSVPQATTDATPVVKEEQIENISRSPAPSSEKSQSVVQVKPVVKAFNDGGKIIVQWEPISSELLQGYKVVISKKDSSPAYPENGYLTYITNKNTTQWIIDNSSEYHGGDFGGYLTPGQAYYISITALYKDCKIAGNAVRVTYPDNGYTPQDDTVDTQSNEPVAITVTPRGNDLVLSWPASSASNFEGYKVVISKDNPNPKYPDDGYLYWITDRNKTSVTVNADTYYQGDIQGNLVPGESYYFSISIIYQGWVIVGGPAQYVTLPE